MTPRLQVEGAVVRFGSRAPLDGVDLSIEPGEIVSVLGASGSGKSTLLRAIAGLQPLTGGRVLLDGEDQRSVAPHRRDVGLMFQDHALFPHRDVRANVAFGLRVRGLSHPAIERRVGELLELVGLQGFGRRSVTTLSGGEQQRVALARALAPEPRLLMLDEPLGSLDRALRQRLIGELRELFRELGLTVVAVTHDPVEAFAMAERMVVLGEGRVLRDGPPADVWTSPGRAHVARVLGLDNLDGTTLVRTSAIRIGPDGDEEATVGSVSFRGQWTAVELVRDDGRRLVAAVGDGEVPATGSRVCFSVDPGGVLQLDP